MLQCSFWWKARQKSRNTQGDGIIIKVEGINSSQNGKNEANNKNKWRKFEGETLSSVLQLLIYYKNLSLVVLICLLIYVLLL